MQQLYQLKIKDIVLKATCDKALLFEKG